jgi:hypothetical protein
VVYSLILLEFYLTSFIAGRFIYLVAKKKKRGLTYNDPPTTVVAIAGSRQGRAVG